MQEILKICDQIKKREILKRKHEKYFYNLTRLHCIVFCECSGVFCVKNIYRKGKIEFLDEKGNKITSAKFEPFTANFLMVKEFLIHENTPHFINTKGEDLDLRYSLEGKYDENNLNIIKNNFSQFCFLRDLKVFPNFYDQLTFYTDAYFAMVKKSKKIGLLKLNGN